MLNEMREIKDQLFAVSMANVGDDDTDEFENYNKIIVNEISALRDQVDFIKDAQKPSQRSLDDVVAEIEEIKLALSGTNEKITSNSDEIDAKLDRLRDEMIELKQSDVNTNISVLQEIASLKDELKNIKKSD
jgi:uncharacterized coiled-coil DUF342 family protein